MLIKLSAVSLVLLGGLVTWADDAVPTPPGENAGAARPAAADANKLQRHMANCLILGNQEELALCDFAKSQTQNQKVKELIEKMVSDHTQFVTELRKFSGKDEAFDLEYRFERKTGTNNQASEGAVAGRVPEVPAKNIAAETPAPPMKGQGFARQLFSLEHDAVQECLSLTQKNLEKYQGPQFDQAFLGHQVGMHIGMLAKLKAGQKHSSGDFQQLLKKGEATTQAHLQHAEQLMNELSGNTATRTNDVKSNP